MRADGSHPRRLGRGTEPAWSPDGRRIVFTGPRQVRVSRPDLWVMRSDGSHRRRLTANRASDRSADWSPDGRWIAFASDRGRSHDVWRIRPDGSGAVRVTAVGPYDDQPELGARRPADRVRPPGRRARGSACGPCTPTAPAARRWATRRPSGPRGPRTAAGSPSTGRASRGRRRTSSRSRCRRAHRASSSGTRPRTSTRPGSRGEGAGARRHLTSGARRTS